MMLEKFFTKPKTFAKTEDGLYYQYNQWGENLEEQWFVRFLRKNFPYNRTRINFYGPLQNPFFIKRYQPGKKVFYTPEDVEHPYTKLWLYFRDYRIDYVDFAMGFGNFSSSKYLRFPYWMLTTFEPEFNESQIKQRIYEINNNRYAKSRICVAINGHDPKNTRTMICDKVSHIFDITYAGRWRNNSQELWNDFNNDKYSFMKMFKFNICAENDNTENYVTEKLFDAFMCDCIPIYYGSNNNPEPGLINKDAVIFWDKDGDNRKNMELIALLNSNSKEYNDFIHQVKLLPKYEEYVISIYTGLREHFKRVLEV